jgi:hypothetical protein
MFSLNIIWDIYSIYENTTFFIKDKKKMKKEMIIYHLTDFYYKNVMELNLHDFDNLVP